MTDSFVLWVLKRRVIRFCNEKKTFPTCGKFLPIIREKTVFFVEWRRLKRNTAKIGFG
jgi:hypothetical protein